MSARMSRGLDYLANVKDDTPDEVLADWLEVLDEMAAAGLNVAAVKDGVKQLAERRKQLRAEQDRAKLASTPQQEDDDEHGRYDPDCV